MIKKIIVLMILVLVSINNVNAEINTEYVSSSPLSETEITTAAVSGTIEYLDTIYVYNGDYVEYIHSVDIYMNNDYWGSTTAAYGKSDVIYEYNSVQVGDGYVYFWRMDTDDIPGYDLVYIKAYFNDGLKNIPSGQHKIEIIGDIVSQLELTRNDPIDFEYTHLKFDDNKQVAFGQDFDYAFDFTKYVVGTHTSKIYSPFYNEYNYWHDEEDQFLNFNITRDAKNESQIIINNSYIELINETSQKDNNVSVYSEDLENSTWDLYVLDSNGIEHNRVLTFFEEEEEEEEEQPTLTTDKTYYNTSELINISFTNIDTIYNQCTEHICETPYELHILYPVTEQYNQYRSKYIYPLTYNLEDETITLSTSFLSPENNYILGIVGINGYYGLHDDILLFSDDFVVYPDEEYLSVSCDSESTCYTYNNADITIYYQINNNSNIIIKDNDNNVINTYYNIIGNGSILYHIPDDLYYENTYPNWKVYLNNTEYSTSFNKGVTVYWSQFATPTPTPTFTPTPTPDINISDEIDNLKDEISPIKDLLFGLSEIVIDNPDYNKDNIVDENEINHWFNSLIPMCIILLLIILYIGLKKNRND